MKSHIIVEILLFILFFCFGYLVRGCNIRQEIKEEAISRIAYAIQTGMITVNHNRIEEIKNNPTNLLYLTNATNDIDSNAICNPDNESKIKTPEEG